MANTSQLGNQKLQSVLQETLTETSAKGNETPTGKDAPKYTESQWSKMRQSMQKRINELEVEKRTLSSQSEALESDNDSLKETVVSLKQEVDDGLPEEAKDVVSQYRKKLSDLVKKEAEHKQEKSKWESRMKEIDESDRMELAQTLSDKFGVGFDVLLEQSNPEKMKAYAVDNFDPSMITKKETSQESEGEKLDKPVLPGAGGGGTKTIFSAGDIDEMDVKTFAQHRESVLKALAGGKIKD